jgi:ATP-dependent DNA helicase RecG
MFGEAIRAGKPLPDFSASDDHQVSVVIRGEVESPAFVRYLERLGREKLASFTAHDFLVLDGLPSPPVARLIEVGAVEQIGRGRGVRFMLSRSLYAHIGERAPARASAGSTEGPTRSFSCDTSMTWAPTALRSRS